MNPDPVNQNTYWTEDIKNSYFQSNINFILDSLGTFGTSFYRPDFTFDQTGWSSV